MSVFGAGRMELNNKHNNKAHFPSSILFFLFFFTSIFENWSPVPLHRHLGFASVSAIAEPFESLVCIVCIFSPDVFGASLDKALSIISRLVLRKLFHFFVSS